MKPRVQATWDNRDVYPLDYSEALCRVLHAQERKSIWLWREAFCAFTVDGTLILEKRGGLKAVGLNLAEIDAARRAVWTHNHPRISAFSIDDIQRAFEGQVTELRAVDPKWVYRLRDPDGWPAFKWRPLLLAIGLETNRARNAGATDRQESNHLGMGAAANATGMIYTRTQWAPPLGILLRARGSLIAKLEPLIV